MNKFLKQFSVFPPYNFTRNNSQTTHILLGLIIKNVKMHFLWKNIKTTLGCATIVKDDIFCSCPFLFTVRLHVMQRTVLLSKFCLSVCRPSDVYDTDRRTKLTALETISRWLFLKKRKNRSFRALRGNVHTLWLVGKLLVDFIFVVIKFFRHLLRLSCYEQKSVEVGVSRMGGSLWAQISEGRGRRPPTTVGVRVAEWLPFRVVLKYLQQVI